MVLRRVSIIIWSVVVATGAPLVGQTPSQSPGKNTGDQPPAGSAVDTEELDGYRRIISDSGNTPETRRLMAEALLKVESPAAIELVVQLLSGNGDPGAPIAICDAITSLGTRRPELLRNHLVEPLLNLLGGDDTLLSTRAASALAMFRDGDVAGRLGALATDADQPIARRLSAIDALAPNTDRREVVAELIRLAGTPDENVVGKAMAALRTASRVDYGMDVAAWQNWWEQKRALSEAEWLQDRLDLAAQQNGALREELARAAVNRQFLVRRIDNLLRTIYRLTTQPTQRQALLAQWLDDEVEGYRLCALNLIREQITEGDMPSPPVRTRIAGRCADPSVPVRIAALETIGYLKDPADAASVLVLLSTETNRTVRETILRVLGRLDNPEAVRPLTEELKNPAADPGCVREAARSLGMLGAGGRIAKEVIEPAVEPLRARFAGAAADDLRLKEALLDAMAQIGHEAFQPDFAANLSSDSPELILAAIRGISKVGDRGSLDRVLPHLGHSDPRVRQLAAEAVGTLGSIPAHLEALLNRLSPEVEANEGVREAAWVGFRKVLAAQTPAARLQWVDRLQHLPNRQVALLEGLIDSLATADPAPPELQAARDKVVGLLIGQGRLDSAIPHLRDLRKSYLATDTTRAWETGVLLLRIYLDAGRFERVGELIGELASGADESALLTIQHTVMQFIETALAGGDTAGVEAVVETLSALPEGLLGDDWAEELQGVRARLEQLEGQPAPGDGAP